VEVTFSRSTFWIALIREYIWLGDRVVGMYSKDVANTLLRVHTDHLGTPRAVTQSDGTTRQVLWRFEGDAFGDVFANESDDDGVYDAATDARSIL